MAARLPHLRRHLSDAASLRAPRIGLISGSIRRGSFNTQLLATAAAALRAHGADAETIDLGEYPLPLYSQDLEASAWPEAATQLKAAIARCDGMVLASPEYNGFVTPLLLNAVCWASRADPQGPAEAMYATFKSKLAVVMAASPGPMGGLRALRPHRELLVNLGVSVLPEMVAVGKAFEAFGEDGSLLDGRAAAMLEAACSELYFKARDEANREVACAIIEKAAQAGTVGAYGSVPTSL